MCQTRPPGDVYKRQDVERSRKSGVPEQDYSDMPEAFSHVLPKSLGDYMKAQFHYWSEDEIACNFRKMLTLEQYKSSEMSALYQKVLDVYKRQI